MDRKADGILKIPAMGMYPKLGMLYDAQRNQLLPILNLLEITGKTQLANIIEEQQAPSTKTYMKTQDSALKEGSEWDVHGSLKLSFLAGNLSIAGSGKYAKNVKSSKKTAEVTLHFDTTTRHQSFVSFSILNGAVDRLNERIKANGATHFVSGITYGHKFALKFKSHCNSEEEKSRVEGQIKGSICKVGTVEGRGSQESSHNKVETSIEITIEGTLPVGVNPVTLEEAVEVYKILPDFTNKADCPIVMHLVPLALINPSAPYPQAEPTEDIVRSLENIFEEVENSISSLSKIENSVLAMREPRVRSKARRMRSLLDEHRIGLRTDLSDILGDMNSTKRHQRLSQLIKNHQRSPFSYQILYPRIVCMKKEKRVVENLLAHFSNANGAETIIKTISDESGLPFAADSLKVTVIELPIITKDDDFIKVMSNWDPVKPTEIQQYCFPLENEEAIMKITKDVVDFGFYVKSYTQKPEDPMKFRCVLKLFDKQVEPRFKIYDGDKGTVKDMEMVDRQLMDRKYKHASRLRHFSSNSDFVRTRSKQDSQANAS